MKYLLLLSSVLFILMTNSCAKENVSNTEEFDEIYAQSLVEEYNQELIQNESYARKGFSKKGKLISGLLKNESDQLFLALSFKEYDKQDNIIDALMFNFGLKQPFNFPSKLENAQIIFLGNQLIISDLNTNEQFNFFIQDNEKAVNKVSSIETINGAYLAVQTSPDFEDFSLASCSCGCVGCPLGQSCYASSCSCQSSCGGGCSVTCDGYSEAVCSDTCNNE